NGSSTSAATLTATLEAGGGGLNGKTIHFALSDGAGGWTSLCGGSGQPACPATATTNGVDGVATLTGVTLPAGFAAVKSYAAAVQAQFAGDSQAHAVTATGQLYVVNGVVTNC